MDPHEIQQPAQLAASEHLDKTMVAQLGNIVPQPEQQEQQRASDSQPATVAATSVLPASDGAALFDLSDSPPKDRNRSVRRRTTPSPQGRRPASRLGGIGVRRIPPAAASASPDGRKPNAGNRGTAPGCRW